jgi:low affinity Fe/Cu permease
MNKKPKTFNDRFRIFSKKVSKFAGSFWTFLLACLVIVGWLILGPIFGYSDTWQLVINTGTTIVTFLMVFVIQNTQNRDGKATQLKLDELIKATKASDLAIDLENLSDKELEHLEKKYLKVYQRAEKKLREKERQRRKKNKISSLV